MKRTPVHGGDPGPDNHQSNLCKEMPDPRAVEDALREQARNGTMNRATRRLFAKTVRARKEP